MSLEERIAALEEKIAGLSSPEALSPNYLTVDPSTGQVSGLTVPLGIVLPYAGPAAPVVLAQEWNLCNGAALSRSIYAPLFSLIGTTYGAGNGSTTFNIPDLRDRVPVGAGGGIGGLGAAGGETDHQLSDGELASHNHGGATGSAGTDFALPALPAQLAIGPSDPAAYPPIGQGVFTATTPGGGATPIPALAAGFFWGGTPARHNHTAGPLGISSDGGNQPHNNLQPYQILNYVMRIA